jgi:hypothetical protein
MVHLTITGPDVFGTVDEGVLLSRASEVTFDWLASASSTVAAIVSAQGLYGRVQRDAVAELAPVTYRSRALGLFDRGQRHILVQPEAVALGMKVAAHHASPGDELADGTFLFEFFTRLNDLTVVGEGAAATVLHVHASQREAQPEDIAREFLLFHEFEARLPDGVRYGFAERFQEIAGLSAKDFAAYALGIWAVFAQYQTAAQLGDVDFRGLATRTGARAKDPGEFDRFMSLIGRTQDEIKASMPASSPFRLSWSESLGFRTAPLVRLGGGGAVPVWLPWLLAQMGAQPRYVIQNAIHDNNEIRRYRGALGEAFEDYAFSVLERMFADGGEGRRLFLREGAEGCDAIAVVGDSAFFFEMTISEPSIRSLWSGDEEALKQFVATKLAGREKLGQLATSIRDFRAGILGVSAPEAQRVRRIYPLLVGLAPLPHALGARGLLADAVASVDEVMARGGDGIRPLQFVSIGDLEILETLYTQRRVVLARTLDRWIRTGPAVELRNHLLATAGFAGTRSTALKAAWDALVDDLTPRAVDLLGGEADSDESAPS